MAGQGASARHHRNAAFDACRFVMDRLKVLDQVAYVRFASVYRRFEDIDAFMTELKDLLDHKR